MGPKGSRHKQNQATVPMGTQRGKDLRIKGWSESHRGAPGGRQDNFPKGIRGWRGRQGGQVGHSTGGRSPSADGLRARGKLVWRETQQELGEPRSRPGREYGGQGRVTDLRGAGSPREEGKGHDTQRR